MTERAHDSRRREGSHLFIREMSVKDFGVEASRFTRPAAVCVRARPFFSFLTRNSHRAPFGTREMGVVYLLPRAATSGMGTVRDSVLVLMLSVERRAARCCREARAATLTHTGCIDGMDDRNRDGRSINGSRSSLRHLHILNYIYR